jgi:nicotinate-nucleotide adenylyltransferase
MGELPHGAKRIAFFGGSFDPPHLGHLAVARAAAAALGLDAVLFAPVGAQPLKPKGSSAPFDDRVAMTRLAVSGDPAFSVSLADAPIAGGKPNYTLDTLRALSAKLLPQGQLFCLMGADSFLGLRRWHGAAEIPFVAPLIVASRPNEPIGQFAESLPAGLTTESAAGTPRLPNDAGSNVEVHCYLLRNARGEEAPFFLLPGVYAEISATAIRRQLRGEHANARPSVQLLPAAVTEYIRTHGLYR